MPTLYVENVPEELYQALRAQARQNRKSISAEVLTLLSRNIVTPAELKSRKEFLKRVRKIRLRRPAAPGPFLSAEEMQREDRSR